jgi:thiamine-monophosphate kinase
MTAAPKPVSAEDRLIARYFRPIARHPGALRLIDDAAVLAPPKGSDVVLTVDAIVGGVHFFSDDPPDAVARKALRVNLSDLAAKGARPAGFLLTLALPKSVGEDWVKAFAHGLGADSKRYECPLLGGDSVRTPGPVTISITAFGTLPKGTMVPRSGAKTGDRILVTGTVGDAALGLALRQDGADRLELDRRQQDHLANRYLLPQPRNALAEALRRHASAAVDVSDGLVGDLGKLCAASGVSGEVEIARVPLSSAAHMAIEQRSHLIETVLTGGDDYEVVCTVPPRKLASFLAAADNAGVPVTEIGVVRNGRARVRFVGQDGKPLGFERDSFSHF